MKYPYSKSALVGGAYLCLGLCALSAGEDEAAPLFALPEGETETAAATTAETVKKAGAKNADELPLLPEFVASRKQDVGDYSAHFESKSHESAFL